MAGSTRNEIQTNGGSDKSEVLARYNHVVECAELRTIQLTDFNFHIDPQHFSPEVKRSFVYDIDNHANEFSAENGLALAHVDVSVYCKVERKKTLKCTAKYIAVYDNLSDCDEKEVKAFLSRVAPIACYPYFRALFANLNWAAGADMPPLPVHREPTIPRSAGNRSQTTRET